MSEIVGDTAAVLRRWRKEGRLAMPGRPGMRATSPTMPGNWYRTVRFNPLGRFEAGVWVVVGEGCWSAGRDPDIGEVGHIGVLDYDDDATAGALLGAWREYDGPVAEVGLGSMGTERGTVWHLISDARSFVASGPTPGLAVARGICGLGEWTEADAHEYRRLRGRP